MTEIAKQNLVKTLMNLSGIQHTALPTAFAIYKYLQSGLIVQNVVDTFSDSEKADLDIKVENLAPCLVISRYLTAEQIIQKHEFKQIIELGCGFSSHYLNHLDVNYIQVDLPEIIEARKTVLTETDQNTTNNLVAGDISLQETWDAIVENLKPYSSPVAILAEGLMMYLSDETKIFLLDQMRKIKKTLGVEIVLMFEDSLKMHGEFAQNKELWAITTGIYNHIRGVSSDQNVDKADFKTQTEAEQFWLRNGAKITRTPQITNLDKNIPYPKNYKTILEKFNYWLISV